MPIDVAAERARTPGTAHGSHLNAAGAALRTVEVEQRMRAYLDLELTQGGYEAALIVVDELEQVRAAAARLIGATGPGCIAFTEGATPAWGLALDSQHLGEGDVVLVDRATYVSSALMLLLLADRAGVVVEVVGDDGHGQLDVDALDRALGQHGGRARLVAVTHVPTSSGLVNPVAAVGRLTRAHGVPYLLDACQSVGQLVVDVEEIGCDWLAATGRKFLRAPRGTGFLYVREPERLDPRVIDGAGADWTGPDSYALAPDARRAERYEYGVAQRLGLGIALRQATALGPAEVEAHLVELAADLRRRLAELPGVTVLDRGQRLGAIVSFTVGTLDPEQVAATLRAAEPAVRVWWAHRAAAQWSLPVERAVRVSPHVYSDDADIERLLSALRAVG